MPHWVIVSLPQGGCARANWDDPIVKVMRRINAAREHSTDRYPGKPGDYELVYQWREEQLSRGNELAARPVSLA